MNQTTIGQIEAILELVEGAIARITGLRIKLSWRPEAGITLDEIAAIVEKAMDLDPGDISKRSRQRKLTTARQVFILITLELIPTTRYSDLARLLDQDHSSVIYSYQRAKEYREVSDPFFMTYFVRAAQGIEKTAKQC